MRLAPVGVVSETDRCRAQFLQGIEQNRSKPLATDRRAKTGKDVGDSLLYLVIFKPVTKRSAAISASTVSFGLSAWTTAAAICCWERRPRYSTLQK